MGDRNMFVESEDLIMCDINQALFHASNALAVDVKFLKISRSRVVFMASTSPLFQLN